jgi:hypothetical protein
MFRTSNFMPRVQSRTITLMNDIYEIYESSLWLSLLLSYVIIAGRINSTIVLFSCIFHYTPNTYRTQ